MDERNTITDEDHQSARDLVYNSGGTAGEFHLGMVNFTVYNAALNTIKQYTTQKKAKVTHE
jgi:hypothetical protein